MLILTIRTDKPQAEIGLFDDDKRLVYQTWQAHRQLAETIHKKVRELLHSQNYQLSDLKAVTVYKGPGSFTGLRISISAANALADSLRIPIVGETGNEWLKKGAKRLTNNESDQVVMPKYGSPPHITQPRH